MWKIHLILLLQLIYANCDQAGIKLLNSEEYMFNVTQQFVYELEDYGICNTKLVDIIQNISRENYFGYNAVGTVYYKNGFINTFQDVSLKDYPDRAIINQEKNSVYMKANLIISSLMMFYDYYAFLSVDNFTGTVAIPMETLSFTIHLRKFYDNETITHNIDITEYSQAWLPYQWYFEPSNHYTEIINKDITLNFEASIKNITELWNKLLGKAIEKIKFPEMCFMCLVLTYDILTPQNVPEDIKNNIFFLFHNGPTVNDYTKIPYESGLYISEIPEFSSAKNTVFYLHGWTEQPTNNTESVDTIVSAFLLKKDLFNIIVVDYSELVKGNTVFNYLGAVGNISDIGSALGFFLKKFIPDVQNTDQVHLIGHSLGSQIMSKTAKAFGKGKLYWITALDPAGPVFNLPLVDHLSKEDAFFVDVIHTDGWGYGDGRSIGHADFYPNMGVGIQPYCNSAENELCSHQMSWRYYAESIVNEDAFPAKQCSLSFICSKLFMMASCCKRNAAVTHMGLGVNKDARGDFYLQTNVIPPYDLGKDGFYV